MSFDAQINFRATSGYVTDGDGQTYCAADLYPTSRGGLTFGWDSSTNLVGRDRTTGNDVRLAGNNQVPNNKPQKVFRLDLPAAGQYMIHLGIGDASYAQAYQYIQVKDGATARITIDDATGTALNQFLDAAGTEYSAANWPGSETGVQIAMEGTILYVVMGAPTSQLGSSTLAHLRVTQLGGLYPFHSDNALAGGFATMGM